jgi:hypothetical protein
VKQILQSLKTGSTEVAEVPCPAARPGHLLVRTSTSLISSGTERMLVEFGKAGWIEKARQQPDKVRMVLEKVRTDGLAATLEAIKNKLDQPLTLGYCNVGVVAGLGSKALPLETASFQMASTPRWCVCRRTFAHAFQTLCRTTMPPSQCWALSACKASAWRIRHSARAW